MELIANGQWHTGCLHRGEDAHVLPGAQGFRHQNATFTPTVMLRPIRGAAFLMNEVCA